MTQSPLHLFTASSVPTTRSKLFNRTLPPLALLVLAFFLRVYRLADKNVWWDEGWTVWLSQHDFGWIALRTASDEHPPLHYWLMHLWQNLFGTDAFTGRFFSLAFGVLLIALVYRLGQEMGGRRLGLLATLFLALARFNVWWSQDIKNYTLSAFFAWASVYFVWRLIERQRTTDGGQGTTDNRQRTTDSAEQLGRLSSAVRRLFSAVGFEWLGYIVVTFLALFSHYLAALIVLANNVFVLVVLVTRWRRGERVVPFLIRWTLAQIGVVLVFAPWLYVYLQHGATWSAAPTFDFGLFMRLAATVLTLGVTTYIENYTWIVLGMLVVAGLSLGWIVRRQTTDGRQPPTDRRRQTADNRPQTTDSRLETTDDRPQTDTGSSVVRRHARATVLLFLIALIPPALIYLLSLTPAAIFAPKIQARYLMMLTPAVALLLALGVLFVSKNLPRRIGQIAPAALVVLIVAAQLFTLTDYFGERVLRDEYATLSQMINNFGLQGDAIVLDTDQEYPTFLYYLKRPFDWVGVPNGAPVTPTIAQQVASTALQHKAVWVVSIPDALQQDPTHLVEQAIAKQVPKQYEQTFGDKRLVLYANEIRNVKDVPRENFTPQILHDDFFDERLKLIGVDLAVREAYAGDVVSVVTYWAAQDLTTINLSLQKPDGQVLANGSVPISIGAHERAQADLQIPPGIDRSEVRVVAQARLHALPLGTLYVLPRSDVNVNASDGAMQPRTERFGEHIRLMGVSTLAPTIRAGDTVPLTLFWQTAAPLPTSYTVFVHLLGTQYNPAQNNLLWGQVDRLPLAGKLPTTAWTPNQTIADAYQVKFDDHAPSGLYKIEIGLYDSSGIRLHVFDVQGKDMGDSLIVGHVQVGN